MRLVDRPPTLGDVARYFKRTPQEIEAIAAPLCEQQLIVHSPVGGENTEMVFHLTPLGLEASHWVADHHTYQIASELDTMDDDTLAHLGDVLHLLESILIRLKSTEQ